VHIVELSTAVVKVDIKVIRPNASLTQNQCLQCVTLPLLRHHDRATPCTELSNDGRIKLGNVHYKIDQILSIFPRDLINDDSSFCLCILSAIDLQYHVFPFEKFLTFC